jgi:hypothetical protein
MLAVLLFAAAVFLVWWIESTTTPPANSATFGSLAPFASTGTATTHKFHGKDVKVTITMSPVDHISKVAVVHLRYKNLTNRRLNLESGFIGFIDPKTATTTSVPDTDNYDILPVVIASSPKVHTHPSGYGTTWTSKLAPKGSATYKFTLKALGRRMYCLEDVVGTVTKNKNDLDPIAGAGVGCARII